MFKARLLILIGVFLVGAASADACHGLLRRLFGPRTVCQPAPALIVAPEPIPPPKAKKLETTLAGRFTYVGPPLKLQPLQFPRLEKPVDNLVKMAEKRGVLDARMMIDPGTRGVANVVVFLKPPKNGAFAIVDADKIRKGSIVLDAPHCVLEPRILAIYPEWFDGKGRGKTGQKFLMKNSSPIAQNRRATGRPLVNEGFNMTMRPNTEREVTLNPQLGPVLIQDDIHTWMRAFVFVFDHPNFAITKSDGTFTIPRVPAGMEVQIMAWHEEVGWLFGKDGKTMTLKEGKNTLEFEMGGR